MAEDCGLIIDFGTWVLQESCAQLARWRGRGQSSIRLAVNVSALQIHKNNFIDIVKQSFADSRIDPGCCEIEITKSTLQHESNCISVLEQLRAMNVCIAVDDFGTGYSCLSSLKLLPIGKIKIDKSFIHDLAIVQAIGPQTEYGSGGGRGGDSGAGTFAKREQLRHCPRLPVLQADAGGKSRRSAGKETVHALIAMVLSGPIRLRFLPIRD